MKTHSRVLIAVTALALSGTTMAQGGMGMHAGAGTHGMHGMHGGQSGCMMMSGGNVTKAQFLERAEAQFTAMDANRDGVLDAAEHQQMHAHMQGCMGMMHGQDAGGGQTHAPTDAAPPAKP